MLPRAQRLTTAEGFRRTTRMGRRAGSSTLVVHLHAPSPPSAGVDRDSGAEHTSVKVGLVVGKNVGNAVVRNKTKRRLRECARARVGDLPEGAILVIRALPAAAIVDFAQLSADLARSLGRVLGAPVAGSAKR